VFHAVHTASFVIDRQQWMDSRHFTKAAREIVDLIETLDIPLIQEKPAGPDQFKQSTGFTIRLRSLKTDDKKLTNFLLKGEMRIPHWKRFGPPGWLFGFLFEFGQQPQRFERGDGIHVDVTQSIPQLFFESGKKRQLIDYDFGLPSGTNRQIIG
jgi:hypothetical protein